MAVSHRPLLQSPRFRSMCMEKRKILPDSQMAETKVSCYLPVIFRGNISKGKDMLFLSIETHSLSKSGAGGIKRLQTLDMDTKEVRTYAGPELPDLRGQTVVVYDAVASMTALGNAGIQVGGFESVKLMEKLTQGFEADGQLFTPVGCHYFRYSMKQERNPASGVNVHELCKLYQLLRGVQGTRCYQREKAAIPAIAETQRAGSLRLPRLASGIGTQTKGIEAAKERIAGIEP